jgi:hypothetical protein
MPNYSTNLALIKPNDNEYPGTWGQQVNTGLTDLVDQAVSGYTTQAITDGADTVITIPSGSTGVARNMYIECTGALTNNRNLIVPSNRKLYFIFNNTTGGFAVTVKVSGLTGISVPNGRKALLVCNGTDIVNAVDYFASLTISSLTINGAVSLSPANANVTISPTGTGTVTINPATAGTLNNIAIGGTTAAAGTFTTLTVNGATLPVNGVYLPSANTLGFASNSLQRGTVNSTGNWNIVAPSAGIGFTINGVVGTHSTQIADNNNVKFDVGYLGLPQNAQTAAYAVTHQDRGKHISITTGGVTVNVAPYLVGTSGTTANWAAGDSFVIYNNSGSNQTITAGASVTFRLAGTASTGNRTVAQYGVASCLCVVGGSPATFVVSGSGVT